ncbi:MAG: hypothetical protein ACRDUY_02935, partial [Nitriliruptorales bacterium]
VPAVPRRARERRRRRPPRRRSALGQVTVGIALLAVGALALLDAWTIFNPTADQYLAAVVIVLGVGLLVGTWWGRARWLLVLGIILLPLLAFFSAFDMNVRGPMGDLRYRPASLAEVRDSYDVAAGTLLLDLRNVDFGGETVEIDLNVGAGEIVVLVPEDVDLDVEASIGAGELDVENRNWEAFGLRESVSFDGSSSTASTVSRGRVVLDLDVGFGTIDVRRFPRS